jgi:DNA repair exonuclease SbcCD ATPase subunit
MIKSIKLTNFRKHKTLELEFAEGMVAVRGNNEAGKSTLNEAIQYALFGSAALRTNFSDTVTYGEAESTLKVECNAVLGGRAVTFKRGKSGAEVTENGNVIVTGQKECTIFAANLMGADAAAASNLLIANQGSLRGVLEQGPKATSTFVEQLANFDLFDTLIEKMQTKLMLGNTTTIEAEVATAQRMLEITPQPAEPDFVALESDMATAKMNQAMLQGDYESSVARVVVAEKALKAVNDKIATRNALLRNLDQLHEHIARITLDRSKVVAPTLRVDEAEVASLREHLTNAKLTGLKLAAYKRLHDLPKLASRWEGCKATLLAEIEKCKGDISLHEQTCREAITKRDVLKSTLVTSSACGFCGQDISQWPQVIEKNAKVAQSIAELNTFIDSITVLILSTKDDLKELNRVLDQGRAFEWGESHPDWISIDNSFYPPVLSWIGSTPVVASTADIAARLAELEAAQKAMADATSKLTVYNREMVHAVQEMERVGAQLTPFATVDAEHLAAEKAHVDEERRHMDYTVVLTEAGAKVWDATQALETARTSYASAKYSYDAALDVLDSRKGLLETMQFNNALLKKVRAARPIVSDKLWNTVLHSVSTMFSRMRGETSLVVKDNGGFKVNGQSVESLSGSTLDLLALAIRVSLIKVFLPNSNFLLLDEITAACDENRSTSMYGFLKAAEFDQVLLVTHDSIAESIADQLIELC